VTGGKVSSIEAMLILPHNNFAFIHVPKCGGTSFKAALQTGGNYFVEHKDCAFGFDRSHLTLQQIHQWCPQLWHFISDPEVLSMTIVRHPYFRAISAYNYFLRTTRHLMTIESYLLTSFELAEWDERFVHALPQHYFTHFNGKQVVRKVHKLESINEELPQIREVLALKGISLSSMPHINATEAKMNEFSEADRKMLCALVQKIYHLDFEYFNYSSHC
jgi:hypothetical protein